MLYTDQLGVRLGRHTVLDEISFQAPAGAITALLGPNGSGKTTLLRTLAGLLPYHGQIGDNRGVRPTFVRPGLQPATGYLPQDCSSKSRLSALEAVLLGKLDTLGWRVPAAERLLAEQQLAELGIAHLARQPLCELSGGQRQMVFIAQTLMRQPQWLLLDEPVSALDLQHQVQVLRTLREQTRQRQLTTIVVLHDLNAAFSYADHVVLLKQGRLQAAGRTVDVMTADGLAGVFDVPIATARTGCGQWLLSPRHTA